MSESARWRQRFHNYSKALSQLSEAVSLNEQRALSNIEKQGFIKAFEFTHELAWKVMKDFANYQGSSLIMGSRDATREAFKNELISDGINWMAMIQDRNKAVHTYDESTILEIISRIVEHYHRLFLDFELMMKKFEDND